MSNPLNQAIVTQPLEATVSTQPAMFSLSFCGWLSHALKEGIDQRLSLMWERGEAPSLADVQSIGAALEGLEILAGFDPARASSIDCEIIALAIGALDQLGYLFAI